MTDARDILHKALEIQESLRQELGHELVAEGSSILRRQLRGLDGGSGSGGSEPLERKQVTVLFADLSGFTAMSETADPEQVRSTISACFERLVTVIHRYEGTVEKFIGDCVVAMFGAPLAHEDDPERACRVALELMEELQRLNQERGLALGLHVGINTGLVIAGALRVQGQHQYAITGDTVNLAARLEGRSERGQILVGPTTYSLTRRAFRYRSLGGLRLKGKARPVEVHELLGRTEPLASTGVRRTRLVGREPQLEQLAALVQAVQQGRGAVVEVVGEAGTGKSRLLDELRERSLDDAPTWLQGSTLSFTQTISYWPFLTMLREFFGLDEQEEVWERLESGLRVVSPEAVEELAPYLGLLLGLEPPPCHQQRVQFLDAEGVKAQLFSSLRRLVELLSARGPVVLVFEDLHWIDPSSLELLEHLAPLARTHPVMLLILTRPVASAGVESFRRSVSPQAIRLEALDRPACAVLAQELLGGRALAPELSELIWERTQGNPFFLEELARSLHESAALEISADGTPWTLRPGSRVQIPETLQGVIMARVDRLDEEVKGALKSASVIGYSFLARVLGGLLGETASCGPLQELERQQFVAEKQGEPELEYVFRHALAREVVYESISLQQRRDLHGRLARYIESLYDDRLPEFYGLLAYHYARAQEWERAQDYLFRLGDQAGSLAADAEALEHYRLAVEAYEKAFGRAWEPARRAAVERKIGEAVFRRGNFLEARARLEEARRCLGLRRYSGPGQVRLALAGLLSREVVHLLRSPGLRRSTANEPDERFRVNEALGWVEFSLDQERFLAYALEHLQMARREGHLAPVATGSMALGFVCNLLGAPWLAIRYHREAAEAGERCGNPVSRSLAHLGMAIHLWMADDLDQADSNFQNAASLAWEAGHVRAWASACMDRSGLLASTGRLREARDLCQKLVRVGRDADDEHAVGWGLSGLGHYRLLALELEQAEADLAASLELMKSAPDYHALPKTAAHLAEVWLAKGELERADACLEEAEKLVSERRVMSHLMGWLRNARALHGVLRVREAPDDGSRVRRATADCARARKEAPTSPGCLARAMSLSACLAYALGRHAEALDWWNRAVQAAGLRNDRLGLTVSILERAGHVGEAEVQEQARALLKELDLPPLDVRRLGSTLSRRGPRGESADSPLGPGRRSS